MTAPAPEVCDVCGASPLEMVLYPVAIHYKGSGFYSTDYGKGQGREGEGDRGRRRLRLELRLFRLLGQGLVGQGLLHRIVGEEGGRGRLARTLAKGCARMVARPTIAGIGSAAGMAEVSFDRVGKVYPDGTRAVDGSRPEHPGRRVHGARRPVGLRQDHGAAHGARGWRRSPRACCGSATASSTTCRRATATSRWCSRATRSTRTSASTRTSPSGCGLKKLPKSEIDERVNDAAKTLGLEDLLKRKPRNLSGGQRQRVAMGRAIVREPAAFLMDEPLSNLDAKLRVQMRAEISRLQRDLGVTTIYVTHDQVEAMTMGDRVAVMRKGELQQVGRPADAVRPPGQPLRRRLHRLAGDEHARRDRRDAATAASPSPSAAQTLSIDPASTAERPALPQYDGRTVILGIRPEHLEEASLAPDTPPDRRLRGDVELREALGSELMVHFTVEGAQRRRDGGDARSSRSDTGAAEGDVLQTGGALFVGRFGARADVTEGKPVEVSGRHERRSTSSTRTRVSGSTTRTRKELCRETSVDSKVGGPPRGGAARGSRRHEHRIGSDEGRRGATSAVSGSITFDGVWTGAEATAFGAVIKAYNKVYPKREGQLQAGRRQPADGRSRPRSPAAIRRTWRTSPSRGSSQQFVAKKALKPITYSRKVLLANFSPSWILLGTFNHKIYGLVFKASNKSTVWYNVPAFKTAGVKPPTTWTQFTKDASIDQVLRRAAVLDRRRRRLDAHRPVREHLSPAGRGRRSTTQLTAHKIPVDGRVGHRGAEHDGARSSVTPPTWPAARRAPSRPTSRRR